MSCGCIETVNAMLAERNTRLTQPLVLGRGAVGSFDEPVRLMIVTEQIESGRGKKKAVGMFATFCPFCGESYTADAEAGK